MTALDLFRELKDLPYDPEELTIEGRIEVKLGWKVVKIIKGVEKVNYGD